MRVRVPDRLRPIIGKREVIETLGDVTAKEARRLGWIRRAEIERLFEQAEIQLGATPILPPQPSRFSDEDAIRIARRAFAWFETNAPHVPLDQEQQCQLLEDIREEARHVGHEDGAEDASLQSLAKTFALESGIALPEGTPFGRMDAFRFFEAFREGWLEHLGRQQMRLAGEPVTPVNIVITNSDDESGLTLADAVKTYISAPERAGNSDSSKKMDRSRLGAMRDIIGGDRPVRSLNRSDLKEYVEQLIRLPARYTMLFPGMSPADAIVAGEKQNVARLANTSIRRDLQAVKSFFGWLEREELIDKNPSVRIASPKAPAKSARRSFDPSEMRALLAATSVDARGRKDWAYWCTRFAMLQGFRLTEPLGLQVKDIVDVDGIWIIRLRPNAYRSLKTEETARDVPLHPTLIKLGILGLIEGRDKEDLLLPDAPRGKGTAFNAAQKQLGRIVRTQVSDDRNLTFHSLRHSFRDAMRRKEFPLEVQERLGGWKAGGNSSMKGYGNGYTVKALFDWIAKLSYDGVDVH